MLRKAGLLFLFSFILNHSQAGSVPSFITPCKADDNACIYANVNQAKSLFLQGLPELQIPSSDPLDIKDVKSNGNNLNLDFKDMKTIGLSKCVVLDAKRDVKAETMTLVVECPIKLVGKYVANGKILFLEIVGDGDVDIDIEKVKLTVVGYVKVVDGDDGQKHWQFSRFEYTHEFGDRAIIKLTNLYDGDETKAKPLLDAVNSLWKELLPEIGEPLIEKSVKQVVNYINKFFSAFSISELELA